MTGEPRRISIGVPELDSMLGGGLWPRSSTLVAGSPGTGKTTLGLHFLAGGVKAGEPGVLVTFEYLPQQIYRDALQKGWPLAQWEKEGLLRVICTTPDILLARGSGSGTILDEVVQEIGAKRLVVDSMTQFEFLGDPGAVLRPRLAGLVNHLRLMDVTTMMTHEVAQIVGPTVTISNYGLEFLADNIIVMRYVELEGEMRKAVNVLKFRGGAHDHKYRILELTDKGLLIRGAFGGVESISSGTARRGIGERLKQMV
ncbi:MAG: RAD55 family ATPase [Thermoplasmatota archaeon]